MQLQILHQLPMQQRMKIHNLLPALSSAEMQQITRKSHTSKLPVSVAAHFIKMMAPHKLPIILSSLLLKLMPDLNSHRAQILLAMAVSIRSEERRVGKEC